MMPSLSALSIFYFMLLHQVFLPYQKPIMTVKGDSEIPLKTSDGCGEAYDLIINRGNPENGFPATIGYISVNNYPPSYLQLVTIPGIIKDVAFSDVFAQDPLGGNGLRYFAVITSASTYLFSAYPYDYFVPVLSLLDSIETPPGYLKSVLYDPGQLLIINQFPDSTNFTYTFYHLPDLAVSAQESFNINPENIVQRYSFAGDYLLTGDSLGAHKAFKLSPTTFQITQSYPLPPEADNIETMTASNLHDYFLSSPGDSVINLVQLNESNSSFSIIPLLNNAGIAVAKSYYSDEFLFQPLIDSSISNLGKQLINVTNQGVIADTIFINQHVTSIQSGYYLGFGGIYQFIYGTGKDLPHDSVYFTSNGGYSFVTLTADANPSWFVGDVRCYVNVNEIEKNLAITMVPNPAIDNIQIFVSGMAEDKTYKFTITDLNGKLLWEKDLLTKETYTIPMQLFPSGILIMKVDAGTKSVTEKILKL